MILLIDSAGEKCSIAISEKNKIISFVSEDKNFESSSVLTTLIDKACKDIGIKLNDINAVAVNIGPGSYTGLRVGLSTAKGICYALNKPLITVKSLYSLAYNMLQNCNIEEGEFMCPIIKSRIGEFFLAIYDNKLNELVAPISAKTDSYLFCKYLNNKLIFIGDKQLEDKCIKNKNVSFYELNMSAKLMPAIVYKKFFLQDFTSVIDSIPLYSKEVFISKY